MTNSFNFLHPRGRYYGEVKPENLVFNANLQEFAHRVNFIVGLESNGKLAPEAAYAEIEALWDQLHRSKRELGIGQNPFEGPEERAA